MTIETKTRPPPAEQSSGLAATSGRSPQKWTALAALWQPQGSQAFRCQLQRRQRLKVGLPEHVFGMRKQAAREIVDHI